MGKLREDISKRPSPFRPVVPDNAEPEVILGLFEAVETFDSLRWKGHHVVVGPRGSGKSMILRRLSGSVKARSQTADSPEYFGVYVLIRSSHAEVFRRSFRETGESRLFQHFLAAYVLAQVVAEVSSQAFAPLVDSAITDIILKNCPCLVNGSPAPTGMAAVKLALDAQWQEATRIADGVGHAKVGYIQSSRVPDMIVDFAQVLRRFTPEREGIGLLIDSYGYLKELAGFVNEWMRKDLVGSLSVKASGITSHEALNSSVLESRPEPNHDFTILPHQFTPASPECREVFRAIANKRLAREGFRLSVEEILPKSLETMERTGLSWVPPAPTPLEYVAALSGGDVGAFIHTLELIWHYVRKNEGRYPASTEDFGRACRKSSDTYWRETIPVQARNEWRELQSLTRTAATIASQESSGSSAPSAVVIGFHVEESDELEPLLKRVIQSGLRLGILQCTSEERAAMEVNSDYCPGTFELNRRLCAHRSFPLDPRGGAHRAASSEELLKWVETPYHGQDDKPSTGAGARSQFSWEKCVFISCPLPSHSHERPEHQLRLANALFQALVAAEQGPGRLGGQPDRKDHVRDPLDLRVDDFIKEIPVAIKNCLFIVHDVTELSPGVAFELGLALGYGKVRALVWDESRRPFNAGHLPALLATRLNVNHFAFKGERGFKSWLDDTVVRPCLQRLADAQGRLVDRQRNTVFSYIGNRYTDLRASIHEHLVGLREPKVDGDDGNESRRFHRFESLIRTASAAVINYDEEDLLSAVLLGIAAGAETPTIMTYDGGSSRRLTMWGDRPFLEWRAESLRSDLLLNEFPNELRRQLSKGSGASR